MFKIYIASLVLVWLAAIVAGVFAIKRCGCHLYERFSVPLMQENCLWGATAFAMLMAALFVAQPLFSLGSNLAASRGWSAFTGGLVTITIVTVFSGLYGLLVRVAFGTSKAIAVAVLRNQQQRQREACRRLRQQMAQSNFKRATCDDLTAMVANCRRQIADYCEQPEPMKCPVGIKRPLGYIDGAALKQQIEAWTGRPLQVLPAADRPQLSDLNREGKAPLASTMLTVTLHRSGTAHSRPRHYLASSAQGEPEFFELQGGKLSPTQYLTVEVPFVSYYDGDRDFCLPAACAEELEAYLHNLA